MSNRQGGIFSVILMIVFAFLCAAVMATVLVVKTIKVHNVNWQRVTIETPAGNLGIHRGERFDVESAGVPVYPGARLTGKRNGAGASFEWTSRDGKSDKSASIFGAEYITADTPEQVRAYYSRKLNNWIFVSKRNNRFEFEHAEGMWKRIVAITEQGDGTHIGVASIGEPAGN